MGNAVERRLGVSERGSEGASGRGSLRTSRLACNETNNFASASQVTHESLHWLRSLFERCYSVVYVPALANICKTRLRRPGGDPGCKTGEISATAAAAP